MGALGTASNAAMEDLFLAIDDEIAEGYDQQAVTCDARSSYGHSALEVLQGGAPQEWKTCLWCDGQVDKVGKSCRKAVCEGIKGSDGSQEYLMVISLTVGTNYWQEGMGSSYNQMRACVPCKFLSVLVFFVCVNVCVCVGKRRVWLPVHLDVMWMLSI